MNEDRTGKAIIKASRPFAVEDRTTTWKLFGRTMAVAVLLLAVAGAAPHWTLRAIASVLLGLTVVRFFIFYHDCLHRAVFRKSKLGRALMSVYGLLVLTPPRIWRDSHNYHHAHTSKLVGSSIGSYPLLTYRMYQALSLPQRLAYRATRHWLTILMGYFTIFLVGMCLKPLFNNPRRYWDSALALVVHGGLIAALTAAFNFETAFFVLILPTFVACASGAYLFYAQHTFPGMELRDRREWEYTVAALRSSSMTEMSPLMHWFTGNIGYHHVHHLNPAIPFYRLPEAMAQVPELQNPIVTGLKPKDIIACLRIHLWDPEQKTMLTYREAAERYARRAVSVS